MDRTALIEQIRNAPEDHPLSLIEWIPVVERLPEASGTYFVLRKGRIDEGNYSHPFHEFSRHEFGQPSHWAEKPELPEVRDED